jgi:hypothetical protein
MTITAICCRTVNRNLVNTLCINNEVPPSKVVQMKQMSYPIMFDSALSRNNNKIVVSSAI